MTLSFGLGKLIFIERKKADLGLPAWPFLALSFTLMGIGAFVVEKWFIFLIPPCGLHKMTGIACPTCGACRMAFAFLKGDFAASFAVQPFMFLILVFFALWILCGFIALLFGKMMFIELTPFWRRYLWITILAAFLLNWVYLIGKGI